VVGTELALSAQPPLKIVHVMPAGAHDSKEEAYVDASEEVRIEDDLYVEDDK
jgi:hypothetical protein